MRKEILTLFPAAIAGSGDAGAGPFTRRGGGPPLAVSDEPTQ
jgi:hypothetical protein